MNKSSPDSNFTLQVYPNFVGLRTERVGAKESTVGNLKGAKKKA